MRGLRSLIGSATLAVAFIATSAASASAVTITGGSGSPGYAYIPNTTAQYGAYDSTITAPARTVGESPAYARSDQKVCVTPRLWFLSSSRSGAQTWNFDSQMTNCAWIRAAATSATVNGVTFSGTIPYTGYSVDVVITWQLTNGSVIGRRTYDYSSTADYQCLTFKCFKGTSTIGAWIDFDF